MTSNPFSPHAIEHLSPSSCALWSASPASYVLQYLLKKKSHVGAAAHRGTATESGVVMALTTGAPLEQAQDHGVAEFNRLTALSGDSRRDSERAAVPGMIKMALGELSPYGPPTARQEKVELQVDSLAVPIIGYYDFLWDNHGVLCDLKTLHALPSQIRTAHARQVAFYLSASGRHNHSGRVTYATSRKVATYEVDEPARHVDALVRIAMTIQRFLSLSSDPHYLASLVTPDFDSFYWSDPQTRQDGFDVWGY